MTWNLGDASWKKCRGINHIADNAVQVTGEHSHVPYPAKFEVNKQWQLHHQDQPSQDTLTHATLSQEIFAGIPSYSFTQRMIHRRNLNPIQDGSAGWSCHTCPSVMKLGTVVSSQKKVQKYINHLTHHLGFCRHQRYHYFDYVCKSDYSRPS